MCRPTLSWDLISRAGAMCQVLGYHRMHSRAVDTERARDEEIALFWYIYMMDKTTSLRLGRASTLQEYDISVPIPNKSTILPQSFMPTLKYWIETIRIQGQIFEQLYSPAASLETQPERARRATVLAAALEEVFMRHDQLRDKFMFTTKDSPRKDPDPSFLSGLYKVMHHSALALIKYVMPSTTTPTVSPALKDARSALRAVQTFRQDRQYENVYFWAAYCHWVTLNVPFTPFIVVFGHVIGNYRAADDDLELLRQFTASLELAGSLSEGINRFHQLCSVFCSVAEAYKRAKSQEAPQSDDNITSVTEPEVLQPDASEFEEHLSALGYGNMLPWVAEPDNSDPNAGIGIGQNYFHDWFTGNISVMGLMECHPGLLDPAYTDLADPNLCAAEVP